MSWKLQKRGWGVVSQSRETTARRPCLFKLSKLEQGFYIIIVTFEPISFAVMYNCLCSMKIEQIGMDLLDLRVWPLSPP